MSLDESVEPVVKGDYGVPLSIDTGLPDLSGYTLKIVAHAPDGTLKGTYTGSDGGDGPIGKKIDYTTTKADRDDDDIFNLIGDWRFTPQISDGSTTLRHGSPPMIIPCVNVGKDY